MLFKVLHLDQNHPYLIKGLQDLGFENIEDYNSPKELVQDRIGDIDGIVIRSRFKIDKTFIDSASNLKFIARVGAGLENIDVNYAKSVGIELMAAPEGNRNAVAEHALGMLLALMNNFFIANQQVKNGLWHREPNRGHELDGKTIGLIGYGNTGKAFAKKLQGFEVTVVFHDVLTGLEDANGTQVTLEELQQSCDVLSLHIPETPQTVGMINKNFIDSFKKPFWFLNTARGKAVVTQDLVEGLKNGKILGAGLDVLEYEKASFENLFDRNIVDGHIDLNKLPSAFKYLMESPNVLLTPHVAGWTHESKLKLAQTIVSKIKEKFS